LSRIHTPGASSTVTATGSELEEAGEGEVDRIVEQADRGATSPLELLATRSSSPQGSARRVGIHSSPQGAAGPTELEKRDAPHLSRGRGGEKQREAVRGGTQLPATGRRLPPAGKEGARRRAAADDSIRSSRRKPLVTAGSYWAR
jgi:hypothetical protein